MYSYLMFALAAADTVLLVYTVRQWRRLRQPVLGLLAFLVLALPYDTALVGRGPPSASRPASRSRAARASCCSTSRCR
jgi:4-amino-4-deoxy-L-arabinose transferase-like glycosyltransferase